MKIYIHACRFQIYFIIEKYNFKKFDFNYNFCLFKMERLIKTYINFIIVDQHINIIPIIFLLSLRIHITLTLIKKLSIIFETIDNF